jgi:hypothetical protein
MPASRIGIQEGSGKNADTFQRAKGAFNVEDQWVLEGENAEATYVLTALNVSLAVATDHCLQIMSGASFNVRVKSIRIRQFALAGAVNTARFDLFRLTTAGTGGGTITPRPYDTAESAAGCTGMTLPTAKGTEGVLLDRIEMGIVAAHPLTEEATWTYLPGMKPIIIPAGTANGLALKNVGAIATATADIVVRVIETNFL